MHYLKKSIILLLLIFSISCNFDFVIGPWEDGIIPYYLKGEFSGEDIQNIKDAMNSWENVCGVSFIQVTPRSNAYAIIRVTQQEWYSSIGENNSECHMIFGRYYSDIGVIIHELGHCLGLVHEHQRPDRDFYITVVWDNILTGKEFNFDIMDNPLITEQNFDYDYESIMHYAYTTFSINGKPTLESKYPETPINPGNVITLTDAARAKAIYGPPKTDQEREENEL